MKKMVRIGLLQKKKKMNLVVLALSKIQEQTDFQRNWKAISLKWQKEMPFSTAHNYIFEDTTAKCCCIKVLKTKQIITFCYEY